MAKRTRAFKSQRIYNTDTEMSPSDDAWEKIFGKKPEDYLKNREGTELRSKTTAEKPKK